MKRASFIFALLLWPLAAQAVTLEPSANIGANSYSVVAANSNNSAVIKASGGSLYSIALGGVGAAPAYVKLYDKATAPTCGTDVPVARFIIPAAATAALGMSAHASIPFGRAFTNGIGICIVTGIADSDNTAVAAATFLVNINYK